MAESNYIQCFRFLYFSGQPADCIVWEGFIEIVGKFGGICHKWRLWDGSPTGRIGAGRVWFFSEGKDSGIRFAGSYTAVFYFSSRV